MCPTRPCMSRLDASIIYYMQVVSRGYLLPSAWRLKRSIHTHHSLRFGAERRLVQHANLLRIELAAGELAAKIQTNVIECSAYREFRIDEDGR